VFAKFDESRLDTAVPEEIRTLWKHVEDDWDNQARHALFVEQALAAGHGGYAAGCYRRRGDDPKAVEQLERIIKRLEQLLAATAQPPEERKSSSGRKLVFLLLFLLMFALGALLVMIFRP
jgi:hypothetical protein